MYAKMPLQYSLLIYVNITFSLRNINTYLILSDKCQTWALALFFQIRSPLSAHFNSMDRYCSIAHFADFQVRSSLNRSRKDQWFTPLQFWLVFLNNCTNSFK